MAGFTEDRHKAIGKVTQTWGKDTSATDKALRNCILGTALSAIEETGEENAVSSWMH